MSNPYRPTRRRAPFAGAALAAAAVVTLALGVAPEAAAAPTWAPAATAAMHPGVQTFTAGAQCTANFVFTDGATVYIGQAAHCSGTGGSTETDGCTRVRCPVGTPVEVDGRVAARHDGLQLVAHDAAAR